MIGQNKDDFTQQMSFKEILDELEITKNDYYRALLISNDEYLELHLKTQSNFCFVNNYFVALKPCEANKDIQPVFNGYKAVTYMSQ